MQYYLTHSARAWRSADRGATGDIWRTTAIITASKSRTERTEADDFRALHEYSFQSCSLCGLRIPLKCKVSSRGLTLYCNTRVSDIAAEWESGAPRGNGILLGEVKSESPFLDSRCTECSFVMEIKWLERVCVCACVYSVYDAYTHASTHASHMRPQCVTHACTNAYLALRDAQSLFHRFTFGSENFPSRIRRNAHHCITI